MAADIDLQMSRREAVRRMTETVTAGRFERRTDPGTLRPVLILVETYYVGRARVKFPSASAWAVPVAGQQIAQTNITVSLPSGSPAIPEAALIVVDDSTSDPILVGRTFRVKGPAQAGQTTAHRYPVVEES